MVTKKDNETAVAVVDSEEKSLDIRDFLDVSSAEDDGVWVDCTVAPPDSEFAVKVRYLDKASFNEILREAGIMRKGFRVRLGKEADDKFIAAYAAKAIIEWRGLDLKTLVGLIRVNLSVDGKIPKAFECTPANKMLLIKNSSEFDTWLQGVCSDVKRFNEARNQERFENLKLA